MMRLIYGMFLIVKLVLSLFVLTAASLLMLRALWVSLWDLLTASGLDARLKAASSAFDEQSVETEAA